MRHGTIFGALALFALMTPAALAQEHGHQQEADRFTRMEQMMERMQQAEMPEERQKLMRQHMQMMHEQMQAMRSMLGGDHGGEDAGGMGGMMRHDGADMPMQEHMQRMQNRMDMMQTMMEQMMAQHRMMLEPAPQDDTGRR